MCNSVGLRKPEFWEKKKCVLVWAQHRKCRCPRVLDDSVVSTPHREWFGLYLKARELQPPIYTYTHNSPPWCTVVGNAEGFLADNESLLTKHQSNHSHPSQLSHQLQPQENKQATQKLLEAVVLARTPSSTVFWQFGVSLCYHHKSSHF